jgi:tetratricopeptide (TPR) repeat protein
MIEPLRPELERALAAALDVPDPEQQAFLEREYAHDPELRAAVESMVRAYRAAASFLEPSGTQRSRMLTAIVGAPTALPSHIGRYRIIRLVGEGGMGVVYEAEQDKPRRTVAVKVLRPEFAKGELRRRFEQEWQALARLQHPGIAQIHEVGTAQSGFGPQPYFVMELIRGDSLLRYANAHQLNTRQRLALMENICDAVHHAHQRGIVHRDLKPGNICVDQSGHPKVLDFGVSRIMDCEDGARQTECGQIVGTLAYMSPEQVAGDPRELDARSDVYALGVILFELLSGHLPYELSHRLHEAVPMIQEGVPKTLGSIDRQFRGDVETIVARALEKEKVRRYSSAADMAADIGRFLKDEPIRARPPSLTYQLRKFAQRHRAAATAAVVVVVALVVGIVASTREAARARRAEQTAIAERNRARAEQQRADREASAAAAINDFLENDLLAQAGASVQARPGRMADPDLKVRTALDRAASRISGKFAGQPLIEASIRHSIGKAYRDLGMYADAHRQMQRALELERDLLSEEHPVVLGTVYDIAEVFADEGKYRDAEPLLVRVLEARRGVLDEAHPATLATMNAVAEVYANEGDYARAEPLYRKVLDIRRRLFGELHPDTLQSRNSLARLVLDVGRYSEAEPLCAGVLRDRQRVLGENHPDTLVSEDNLARLCIGQGRYAQAERLLAGVLKARQRVLGKGHPDTFISMNNLAVAYRKQGKLEEAVHLLQRALPLQRQRLGETNPDTLLMMNNLARAYIEEGRYTQAEPLLTKVVEVQCRVVGERHPDTLIMMRNLARLYRAEGKLAEAKTWFSKVVELQGSMRGATER